MKEYTPEQRQALDMVKALMPDVTTDEEAEHLLRSITFNEDAIRRRKRMKHGEVVKGSAAVRTGKENVRTGKETVKTGLDHLPPEERKRREEAREKKP